MMSSVSSESEFLASGAISVPSAIRVPVAAAAARGPLDGLRRTRREQ